MVGTEWKQSLVRLGFGDVGEVESLKVEGRIIKKSKVEGLKVLVSIAGAIGFWRC
jgi:hypothetical protein